jgi:hypothetical protein
MSKRTAKRKTIIWAIHDDGTGAFIIALVTIVALARLLPPGSLRLFVLNSSESDPVGKLTRALVDRDVEIHCVRTDNLCRIPKSDGEVDLVEVRRLVSGLSEAGPRWAERLAVPWNEADLVVSLGVPWAHARARSVSVLSIELGDMIWSRVYDGMCAPPRCPTIDEALNELKRVEQLAKEAYLIPYMAPAEYEPYLAAFGVQVTWAPVGAFWTGGSVPRDPKQWEHTFSVRKALCADFEGLKDRDVRIMVISAGRTPVWDRLIETIAGTEIPADLAFVRSEEATSLKKAHVRLLEKGRANEPLPATSELRRTLSGDGFSRALAAASHLVLARSAGGVLGGGAAWTVAGIAKEPGHWLGERQRSAVLGRDVLGGVGRRQPIALELDLDELRTRPEHVARKILASEEYGRLGEAIKSLPSGIEQDVARTLATKYLGHAS